MSEETLKIEELNSQRISNLESDVKEVRKDVAQLMRELPNIVQDAVSQAITHVKDATASNGKNGLGLGAVAFLVTLFFSGGAMLQQQIVFLGGIADKTHYSFEKYKETDAEESKWFMEYVKSEIRQANEYNAKEHEHLSDRINLLELNERKI